jgi:hypothetical protein
MKLRRRSTRWLLLVLVAGLWSLIASEGALASHFRYGHFNWRPAASANTIEFTLQNAFRRSANPCVDPATSSTTSCSAPDGMPAIGDVIVEFTGGTTFNPGDASGTIGSPMGPLMYQVAAIDPANDWLFGVALDPASLPAVDTLVTHTYAAPGNYTGFIDSGARITHINNSNGGYRVETLVNVGTQGANASPVSALPPIVLCPINGNCTFQVPGSDPNGDTLAFRLSTSAEASSSGFTQPGPPHAPNAAAISSTGTYTWDTTGATLAGSGNTYYSTQVTIEDRTAAGAVKSKVAVDFLIQLVQSVGSPPVFDSPPTPACGSTQSTSVGSTLSFVVQASDVDSGDVVTLNAVGLPPGATMTPPLPTSGNPVSSTFSWTPAATGTFVVTFTATDQTFQQALCSITVEATEAEEGQVVGKGSFATGAAFGRVNFEVDADSSGGSFHFATGNGNRFVATTVEGFSRVDNMASFEGEGTWNGASGYTYEVSFVDNGTPGRNDTIDVVVRDATGAVVFTSGGPQRLKTGNVVVSD